MSAKLDAAKNGRCLPSVCFSFVVISLRVVRARGVCGAKHLVKIYSIDLK